jgi:hypothetical protein
MWGIRCREAGSRLAFSLVSAQGPSEPQATRRCLNPSGQTLLVLEAE